MRNPTANLTSWTKVSDDTTRDRGSSWEADKVKTLPKMPNFDPIALQYGLGQRVSVGKLTLYGISIEGAKVLTMDLKPRGLYELSHRPLKHSACTQNQFSTTPNGRRAGEKEARGDGVDEASPPPAKRRCTTKPRALVDLNRNRQILTRFQSLRIAETFPFLALPAELRLLIYTFCFTFAGLDKWFDCFWNVLETSSRPSDAAPPLVYWNTPTALLICKQIYFESRAVLRKQSLTFSHGLLDICSLDSLMNTNIIKNISSLTIDATGHKIIPKRKSLIGPSWRGHLDLIVDISNILETGHRLKTFTLNFEDETLRQHVHECIHKSFRCDYRDQLDEALAHLRKIRRVGNVTLKGIPTAMITGLKARMESTPLTFFDLPGEIRNQIYADCANWSDISTQLTRVLENWPVAERTIQAQQMRVAPTYPPRSTPTVLLLNKRVYHEAKSILYAKPLVLNMPGDPKLQKTTETLNAIRLISSATLAKVEHLEVRIESWEWTYTLDRIVLSLSKKHSLKSFKMSFRDSLKLNFLIQDNPYPDNSLHLSLSGLAKVRGIGLVEFAGDLPAVYTAPLKSIMESEAAEGEVLPVMKGVKQLDGEQGLEVVDIDEAD